MAEVVKLPRLQHAPSGPGGGGPGGPKDERELLKLRLPSLRGEEATYWDPAPDTQSHRNAVTRGVDRVLGAGLNYLADKAMSACAELSDRIYHNEDGAREALNTLHRELRTCHLMAKKLEGVVARLAPNLDGGAMLPGVERHGPQYLPHGGNTFSRSLSHELAKWFPGVGNSADATQVADTLSSMRMPPPYPQNYRQPSESELGEIRGALKTLEESARRIKETAERYKPDKSADSVEREVFVTKEEAQELSEMIMRHQRKPGDPEIREKGVVISDYPSTLVLADVAAGCQALLCRRNGEVVGLAFFHPPGRIPNEFSELKNYFSKNNEKNGMLLQVLVRDTDQGTGIFEQLMNATLLMAQSYGSDALIGHIEHSNDHAKRAYGRYNGVVHSDLVIEVRSPSGAPTRFLGLYIPVPG